ncbi:MAG: LVIVD repeat-containing protein [Candidatus Heimdallarchaeaceae archaeon]
MLLTVLVSVQNRLPVNVKVNEQMIQVSNISNSEESETTEYIIKKDLTLQIDKVGNILGGNAHDVQVVGTLAYIADGLRGLQIIDIKNPANPELLGNYDDDGGSTLGVFVIGSYAYVADDSDGLEIIDVSDPSAPFKVGSFYDGGYTDGEEIESGVDPLDAQSVPARTPWGLIGGVSVGTIFIVTTVFFGIKYRGKLFKIIKR